VRTTPVWSIVVSPGEGHTHPAWSWVRSAGAFASVAGILAAFTISAIVLILSVLPPASISSDAPQAQDAPSQGRERASAYHLFYAFLVALYSFVAAALLFADITGEAQEFTSRSFFTGMFAGTITALAVVQLLLAIISSGTAYAPTMSLVGAKTLYIAVTALAALLVQSDVLISPGCRFGEQVTCGNGNMSPEREAECRVALDCTGEFEEVHRQRAKALLLC
jgi:magnesium-transporting ATPase (P-type)